MDHLNYDKGNRIAGAKEERMKITHLLKRNRRLEIVEIVYILPKQDYDLKIKWC